MNKQYWIIDTDTPGMSQGEFSASGPYPSKKAAENHIRRDTRETWEDAGASIQTEMDRPWCKPLHIVEVIKAVQPEIRGIVTLTEIFPQ